MASLQNTHLYGRHLVLEWAKEQGHCKENVAALINPKTAFGKMVVVHHASVKVDEMHTLFARVALEKELQSVLALKLMTIGRLTSNTVAAPTLRPYRGAQLRRCFATTSPTWTGATLLCCCFRLGAQGTLSLATLSGAASLVTSCCLTSMIVGM